MNEKTLLWLEHLGYDKSFVEDVKNRFDLSDKDILNYSFMVEGLYNREKEVVHIPDTVKTIAKYIGLAKDDENSVGAMNIKINTNFSDKDKEVMEKYFPLNKDSLNVVNNSRMAAMYILANNKEKDINDSYRRYVHGTSKWDHFDDDMVYYYDGITSAIEKFKDYSPGIIIK